MVRFDGVKFTVFERGNTPAFKNNNVSALLADSDGSLWIGTQGGGVVRFKDGRFSAYTTDEGLPSDFILSLCKDSQEDVWIGTLNGGSIRYRDDAFFVYNIENGLVANTVNSIAEDHNQNLLIGTTRRISDHGRRFENIESVFNQTYQTIWRLYRRFKSNSAAIRNRIHILAEQVRIKITLLNESSCFWRYLGYTSNKLLRQLLHKYFCFLLAFLPFFFRSQEAQCGTR